MQLMQSYVENTPCWPLLSCVSCLLQASGVRLKQLQAQWTSCCLRHWPAALAAAQAARSCRSWPISFLQARWQQWLLRLAGQVASCTVCACNTLLISCVCCWCICAVVAWARMYSNCFPCSMLRRAALSLGSCSHLLLKHVLVSPLLAFPLLLLLHAQLAVPAAALCR